MKTLFAFDFDGTLAKIVVDPKKARTPATTTGLMRKLCRQAPVAIVTGRARKDLIQILQFKPKYVVGNHGLEGTRGGEAVRRRARRVTAQWREALEKELFGIPSLVVENKTFSLAVHYRGARERKKVRAQLEKIFRKLTPRPRVIPGKEVFNLIPKGSPHKGIALVKLMKQEGAGRAFYIGDDHTDEDVFRLKDSAIITIRVGHSPHSAAQYSLPGESSVNGLLKTFVAMTSEG